MTQLPPEIDATTQAIIELRESVRTLTKTLAAHMQQNIDMTTKISDYIGEQMSYRLFRQDIEERNINLQLAQKALELEFMEKKYKALELEHDEETEESQQLKLDRERQKLEIDALKVSLANLQDAKHSTKDKLKTVTVSTHPEGLERRVKDTIVLTAAAAVTAAFIGGTVAFIVWLLRFYVQNTP